MNNKKKRGFTLTELVIVIAVIAILSAILIPTFGTIIGNANKQKEQSAIRAAGINYINLCTQSGADTTLDACVLQVFTSNGTDPASAGNAYLYTAGSLSSVSNEDLTTTTKCNANSGEHYKGQVDTIDYYLIMFIDGDGVTEVDDVDSDIIILDPADIDTAGTFYAIWSPHDNCTI